ncbi:nickel ABC transporter permease [Proteinivorax tanatarense]|uniref:Nickel import system permease protein NikB n=1 Tax=Proteinivorax tanatarense TaxID=1260629 RepID=A0AAU7VN06_9FIRM
MFFLAEYILKRCLHLIFVLFGVSLLTFSLSHLIPGDPAEIILKDMGVEATEKEVESLREELGLNERFLVQYKNWLKNALKGDLGQSFRTGGDVAEEIRVRLPATIILTLGATFIMIVISLPLGILSAIYKNTWIDHLSRGIALIGASMPSFWLALILMYILAVRHPIFPVMGRGSLSHLFLPAFTLGAGMATTFARLIRASMLEVLGEDYILAARSRGLKENIVIVNNALKSALLPVITSFGMSFGHLLGGTVIIENIFAWPGVGNFLVESIYGRDYPVIQGYVLWMSIIFVFVNLIVDISYKFLDPRVSLGRKS